MADSVNITSIKGYVHYSASNQDYTGNTIGLYSNTPYERVYGFYLDTNGATRVTITLRYEVVGANQNLRCVINNTDAMYASATGISTDGVVGVYDTAGGTITFTVDQDLIGLRTYYAHIFAGVNNNACTANVMRTDGKATVTKDGIFGGLVRVWTGTAHRALPYIWTTDRWRRCLAYIRHLITWKMGV